MDFPHAARFRRVGATDEQIAAAADAYEGVTVEERQDYDAHVTSISDADLVEEIGETFTAITGDGAAKSPAKGKDRAKPVQGPDDEGGAQ